MDNSAGDAVEQVLEAIRGEGADKGVEAVGYQAHDHTGAEQSGPTINSLIQAVRPTGRIGVVGVFILEDPTASDELAQQGRFAFDFGTFFLKGQSMGTGQANVKQYNRARDPSSGAPDQPLHDACSCTRSSRPRVGSPTKWPRGWGHLRHPGRTLGDVGRLRV